MDYYSKKKPLSHRIDQGSWTRISLVPAPALYTYEGTPHLPPPGTPSYENQTVLESFTATTALGFTMADLDPTWKAANPTLNTPDKVAAYLWDAGGNGTLV